jgi:addiction module HigA family antidote
MYNPPHPGEIIKNLWLDPMNISIKKAAEAMDISRKTLSNIIHKKGKVTPEIAVRLSMALGSSPESWMGHQTAYDLWQVEQHKNELQISPLLAKTA